MNTPGTPKSPLPCITTTPTKSGVPDTVKSSPGSVQHKTFFVVIHKLQNIHVPSVLFVTGSPLIISFCPFSFSQCSSCVPSLTAPAGSHPTQHSGWSTTFAASHIPTCGTDSEPPGSRLPPSGAGGFYSNRSGFFCRKSAGHTGSSDASPDQDAGVSGSQGHFTGNQIKSSICCFACCKCTITSVYSVYH